MVRNYHRKKLRNYSANELSAAIKEVNDFGLSVKLTAAKYGIPPSTLSEHSRNLHPLSQGRATVLSERDERHIVACLMFAADCGWPMDRLDLKDMVMHYCRKANIAPQWAENGPGIEFIRNFEKRWKDILTKRKTVTLTTAKARGVTEEVLTEFFALVAEQYEKHNLSNMPDAIYNLDETGFNTDQSGVHCFFRRGVKEANVLSPTCGKTMFSVLVCGNASGSHIFPPFIVYKSKYLHSTWCSGGPKGTTYASSLSGWMEKSQFGNWMVTFIERKKQYHGDRKVILFLDGHASHLAFEVASLCLENNVGIIMHEPCAFCLPLGMSVCWCVCVFVCVFRSSLFVCLRTPLMRCNRWMWVISPPSRTFGNAF